MTVTTFDYILNAVQTQLSKPETNFIALTISPAQKLLLTLRYLSTGMSFQSLAFSFRLGATTVGNIIYTTCEAIWDQLVHIHMPQPTMEHLKKIANDYYEKWQFPNCIGSIDGKHCRIKKPKHSGSEYFNYRKFFSLVLQAVADADKKFIVIEVGGRGKQSDGGTFHYSRLNRQLENKTFNMPPPQVLPSTDKQLPMVLIGDEAYPLKVVKSRVA
ncbi:uncharacterized protein LOC123704830 [Colias croceus]|uniref:uncharacterized protein LOC123704830 n=1 Tax=Colias crocea TaxID=72248 RepID=UPI001E27CA20|nr:uncharacterized protein LOC123704830 [Colias croceus]